MAPLFLLAAEPTLPGTNFSTGNLEGNSVYIYSTKGNGGGRIAIMKKGSPVTARPQNGNSYLAGNVFGNGQEIAPGEFVVYTNGGTGASFGVSNLTPDTEYYVAFFEYNGSGLTSEYLTASFLSESFFTLSEPTQQPTGFTVTNITGNAATISWTPGNGANRIVLAKRGAPVNANPVELITYYANASVEYRGSNSGAIIGDKNFVVYKGAGSSVNLSEMFPDTTYHFAIFEFNGNSGPVYLTTNPLRGTLQTLPQPTIPSSNITVSAVEANEFSLYWTAGNGTGRMVVIREGAPLSAVPQKNVDYPANPNFELAAEMAPGHKVIYNSSNNNCSVRNLKYGTTYYIGIFEYSGAGNNIGYLTATYATITQATQDIPTLNVTNIDTSFLSAYNANLSFTPGNGMGRLIVMRKDSAVSFVPNNYTNYNYSPTFGDGYANLGNGNFGVYKGSNSTASISLSPNTTYHVAAFEYNGKNYPAFNTANVDTFSFTTKLPPPPTIPSKSLSFNSIEGNSFRIIWTNGNGERRIVIVRKELAVTSVPQNGVQYTNANKAFNLAPEIDPGQKVVYDGTAYYADIDSLEIGTRYYVQVIEYNGTGDITSYLISEILSGNQKTISAPTSSASEVHFDLLTLDKLRVLWRKGNGTRRLILGRMNAPVEDAPVNLKNYNASSYFGGGTKIGESYVIFSYLGSGYGDQYPDTLYTDVMSMTPGNTYYFKVFEYNGVNAPVYKTADPGEGSFYVTFEPPAPSTNFRSTSSDGNSLALQWTEGAGDRRIVVAREGQPVDVLPQDGVDYAENKDFRLAAEIAPGQKVVYDGAGYYAYPEGLNPSTQYYFKIFEYGGTGAEIDYLTSAYDSTEASTKSAPTIQASNVVVSAITPESGNVSWTNGNGERRIMIARKGAPVNIDPRDTSYYYANYFGWGTHLGDGNYVVYKSPENNYQLTQLQGGTTYYLSVYEFNGLSGPVILRPGVSSQFTTLGPPLENAIPAANTEVTNNSFHINYTAGSGQKRMVVLREGSAVNAEPVDNVKYLDNSYFEAGDELGTGNFVVYNGEDNNMVITGLKAGTTYHYAIFEYNAFSGGTILNYLRPSTGTGTVTTSGVVPVTWVSFSGVLQQHTAKLKWTTGYEQNNSYFIIERSANAIDYSEAGRMNSIGNSVNGKTYLFDDVLRDEILRTTSNVYYRIKQVDQDGRSSFSPVINLQIPKQNNLLVYPNPVKKGSLPGIFIEENDKVKAQLFSASGKLLMQQNLVQGYNSLKIEKQVSGLHLLKLWYADGSFKTFKILFE